MKPLCNCNTLGHSMNCPQYQGQTDTPRFEIEREARAPLDGLEQELRDEARLSSIEAERYTNEGNQVQSNRAIGLSAGLQDAADRLRALLAEGPPKTTKSEAENVGE